MDNTCGPAMTTVCVFQSSLTVSLLIQSEAKQKVKNYKTPWCGIRDIVVYQDISLEYWNSVLKPMAVDPKGFELHNVLT